MDYVVDDFLPWFHNVTHVLLGNVRDSGVACLDEQDKNQECGENVYSEEIVLKMRVPVIVLYLTSFYVLGALLIPDFIPSATFTMPKYPTHKIFFWFSTISLIVNFYFFATAFLINQGDSWILKSANYVLVHGLGEKRGILLAQIVSWYWVLMKVFAFFKEAFRIFGLPHDNVRTMQIFYHMLNGLIAPWANKTSECLILKPLIYSHGMLDLAVSNYFAFEPQIANYFQTRASDIQFYIVVFEVSQHAFVLLESLGCLASYDMIIKSWILTYCGGTIAILLYILAYGIERGNADPVLPNVRLTYRHF